MSKAAAPPVTLTCKHEPCGKAFTRKAWELRKPGHGNYCSRVCANAALVGKPNGHRAPDAPPPLRATLTCAYCDVEFTVQEYRLAHGKGKFCSPKCYNKSRRAGVQRDCQTCGARFTAKPSVVAAGGGLFCSIPCSNKSRVGVPPTTKTGQPHKFGEPSRPKPQSQPVRPAPKPDPNGMVWSGSNFVDCHGCGRTRERGRRCQCERLEGIAS